jgi:4-hydroxy-3-methylbut-2-en-1-yl diphosphate reductase
LQARKHFPDAKMHITNELIHNPGVNEKLEEMDVEFIRGENLPQIFPAVYI